MSQNFLMSAPGLSLGSYLCISSALFDHFLVIYIQVEECYYLFIKWLGKRNLSAICLVMNTNHLICSCVDSGV